ncbi:MAG: chorismate mutase [Bacillota bacterium]
MSSRVVAIRGAITVEENSEEEILSATKELLQKIVAENAITQDDIISMILSMTQDLNATFPARAAREMGWNDVALMCTNEIDVPGSLDKCIRVLIHLNSNQEEIEHIYLRRATALRPDLVE